MSEGEAQTLIAFAALWRGCGFCSRGHLYAGNLYYFREHQQLFSFDEREFLNHQAIRDSEFPTLLRQRLDSPRDQRILTLLLRLHELCVQDTEPEGDDDIMLMALARGWEWVGECTLRHANEFDTADPQASIARDKALIAAYKKARDAD